MQDDTTFTFFRATWKETPVVIPESYDLSQQGPLTLGPYNTGVANSKVNGEEPSRGNLGIY
ncbi:hypothetical protein CR513_01515, partial [Mucuna pruriens]